MLIFQGFANSRIVCEFPPFSFKVRIATLTRNQFASNRTWVRIPSSPPKKSSKLKGLLDFPFLHSSSNLSIFPVRTARFCVKQRVFLVKNRGSNPVLLSCPARLHFPSGSRNHLISEEAFPAPSTLTDG